MCKKVLPLLLLVSFISTASAVDLAGRLGVGAEPSKISMRYWLGGLGLDGQLRIMSLTKNMSLDLGLDFIIPLFKEDNMNFSLKPGLEFTDLTGDSLFILIPVGLEAEYFFKELPNFGFTIGAGLLTIAKNGDFTINIGDGSQFINLGFHYYFK